MRGNMGLFRGKRKPDGEWVEGNLLYDIENNRAFIAESFEDNAVYLREVDHNSIGECTGLKDCGNVVLFEHDIVSAKFVSNGARYNFKIIFEAGAFLFTNGKVAVPFNEIRSAVKIGNVTDNPEPLKGGEG